MNHLQIPFEKFRLENGLTVILCPEPDTPLATVNIWYRTGAAFDPPGKSGLSHLFEHMMFQGSQSVPKGLHFQTIQMNGGTLNASTSFDRTNYYDKAPANLLETILWLESDRMGFFLPALTEETFLNQRDVVYNERLERYDNQPYGTAQERLLEMIYTRSHPYGSPIIGFKDEIPGYTLDDVRSFFQTHYVPNNAALTVIGGFNRDDVKDMIERYFGEIPPGKETTKPEVPGGILQSPVFQERVEDVQLPRIYLAWNSVPCFDSNEPQLEVVQDILAGNKSSRLIKRLVYEEKIAQSVQAYHQNGKFGGFFTIQATAKPGVAAEQLKTSIMEEIQLLQEKGTTDSELERSKNWMKALYIYMLQSQSSVADLLNHYDFYLGTPSGFEYDLSRFQAVTPEQCKEAANSFLTGCYAQLTILPDGVSHE